MNHFPSSQKYFVKKFIDHFDLDAPYSLPRPNIFPESNKNLQKTPSKSLVHTTYTFANNSCLKGIKIADEKYAKKLSGLIKAASNLSKRVMQSDEKEGYRMATCGQTAYFDRPSCGHDYKPMVVHNWYCRSKFCLFCCKRYAQKLARHLGKAIANFVEAHGLFIYFLTLTKKDTPHLPDRKLLNRWHYNFFRRKFWKDLGLIGGVRLIEVVIGAFSHIFHVHSHCLVITKKELPIIQFGAQKGKAEIWFNQQISDEWRSVTHNDSYIVMLEAFDGDFNEIMKYFTKDTGEMTDAQLAELVAWQKGQHRYSLFGDLAMIKEIRSSVRETENLEKQDREDRQPCPECGWPCDIRTYLFLDSETCKYKIVRHSLNRSIIPKKTSVRIRAGPD